MLIETCMLKANPVDTKAFGHQIFQNMMSFQSPAERSSIENSCGYYLLSNSWCNTYTLNVMDNLLRIPFCGQ
jgi:hypothetical protein